MSIYAKDNMPLPDDGPLPHYALFAAIWAVGTVTVLILLKGYAYWQSGSAAVLATLTDSMTDAGISLTMLMAIRLSIKPADENHRYGHGKVEGLAALFQAAMMTGAGTFLLFEGLHRFVEPRDVEHHLLGISVAVISIILTMILIGVQNYALKRAPSLAVESDRAHFTTDVFLNASVMLALIAHMKGWASWVDPAAALAIAGYFGWTAFTIGKKAADMLMDRELPDAVRQRIIKTAQNHPEILGIHDLRTRRSGMSLHISFDVEIDPEFTLRQAHDVIRGLEQKILEDYPYAEILIHMDPHGDTYDSRHRVQGVHH